MRIASGIISLIIGILVFLQSCTVSFGDALFSGKTTGSSGDLGMFVAFLLFIGGAFAFALPKVAMIFSAAAALFAFINGATSDFSDMKVWGVIALILAVMEFFGARKPKNVNTPNNVDVQ
ncbi:hypothetical protein [Carboxydothermus hydrogenoformans]|uniref:Putative lipoprotein n=1 Tax=Carboxydothermus hydrogenoformans (strain ATCC BAA-161 / DSM 6008 / Z-2901) TaxID=246194 RepID=Q3ADU2_CARHZ|nr:hypothetical protein [Carboxydothermus hydrogenoformans]ABB14636.1 putative lipoprotein [Carboxydothermus hydrogenoformans Z-2901]